MTSQKKLIACLKQALTGSLRRSSRLSTLIFSLDNHRLDPINPFYWDLCDSNGESKAGSLIQPFQGSPEFNREHLANICRVTNVSMVAFNHLQVKSMATRCGLEWMTPTTSHSLLASLRSLELIFDDDNPVYSGLDQCLSYPLLSNSLAVARISRCSRYHFRGIRQGGCALIS